MTKRKLFIVGTILATATCAALVIAYVFRDPVNASACHAIQKGMTEAEVIRILGRPCDALISREVTETAIDSEGNPRVAMRVVMRKTWYGAAGNVTVGFDETKCVDHVWFFEIGESVWRKIYRALRPEEEQVPTPYYLGGTVQYFPPSPPYPLPKELENLEDAAKKANDNPVP